MTILRRSPRPPISPSMEQQPLLSNGNGRSDTKLSRTITYEESLNHVPWQTDNDHILTGYRRQLHTIKACVGSAFMCKSALLLDICLA